MTIRGRILTGCLTLMLLTGITDVFLQRADRQLAGVALDIYDNAFMAVNYLRSAQVGFATLAARAEHQQPVADPNVDVLGDLDVALERAMSPLGRARVAALRAAVAQVLPELADQPAAAAAVQAQFERAVETFADDGFKYRKRVAAHIEAQLRETGLAMGGGLLASLIVTLLVNQLIAPPVHRAVRIAKAVAGGRLDNQIKARGRGETADLLRALGVMQANIKALMDAQAASHAGEIASHHARMAAALDHMNQGLCLFDAEDRLLVANRRFASMFGVPRPHATSAQVLAEAGLGALLGTPRGNTSQLPVELADGRLIAVSQAEVAGGGWVATYEDITERQAAEQRLVHMARHDLLTGLPNRLQFGEYVKAALARAPPDLPMAMLYLNLDRFRVINNTLGPAIGDALLQAAAERLRGCIRTDQAAVFCLGGDEFAVFQAGDSDLTMLAEQLIARFAEPFQIGQQSLQIGVSIGIARAEDMEVQKPEVLMRCSALALRQAKTDGRGCYRVFTAAMDTLLQSRRRLEIDLREALARGEMMLVYQPQISVGRGICGFEALLRWRHPDRGMVSPAVFVPLAEELGLIGALGNWVLHRACVAAAQWPDAVRVAVNLSPLQLHGRAVTEDVAAALAESGLPPERLVLEITEAVMLQSDANVLQTLHGLRALGVQIAMDDFGTGYSSLGYLSRFPFDKIKIDQSFVRAMTERADCLAIIRAVIGLGRALGMSVLAEGVETQEQCDRLTQEGCSEIQGYLFGLPLPESAIDGVLARFGVASQPLRAIGASAAAQ